MDKETTGDRLEAGPVTRMNCFSGLVHTTRAEWTRTLEGDFASVAKEKSDTWVWRISGWTDGDMFVLAADGWLVGGVFFDGQVLSVLHVFFCFALFNDYISRLHHAFGFPMLF